MQKTRSSTTQRRGVTLLEVLMSLMIMVIGVTSVITLFPISALRSAQATRLTHAALLKQNVEALLVAEPDLIFDPDGDGDYREHFRGADQSSRNYIIDPIGINTMAEFSGTGQLTPAAPAFFGNLFDGTTAAPPLMNCRRFDGGIVSRANAQFGTTIPFGSRAARLEAQKFCSLGDSWSIIYDFVPDIGSLVADGSGNAGAIVMPLDLFDNPATDVDAISAINDLIENPDLPAPEWAQIVIFSADQESSQTFPLLDVVLNGGQVEAIWSEQLLGTDFDKDGEVSSSPLPPEFGGQVGRVIIQTIRSVDYSWLLTVRRNRDGGVRSLDIVVRYGKDPEIRDETTYVVTAATPDQLTIDLSTTPEELLPNIGNGGYLFDTAAARWHRIRDHQEVGTNLLITFEIPADPVVGPVLFYPGVVEVYSLPSRDLLVNGIPLDQR